jgi:hypothetical protein
VEEAVNPRAANRPQVSVTTADLTDLVSDLGREAVVVVEDSINDECFLLAMAAAFGEHRIVAAEKRRWLRFAHAGGKSRMHQFVARERVPFKIVIRVAALIDSDRRIPQQRTPNHDQIELIRAVDGVTEVHVWGWREIENYVPCRVWDERFPSRSRAVKRLRDLPLQERAVIDVKQELGGSIRSPLIPAQVTLTEDDFAELGAEAVAELKSLLAMIHRIL